MPPPPGLSEPARVAHYDQHCAPDVAAAVARIEAVRRTEVAAERAPLEHVYVIIDGGREQRWMRELERALRARGAWVRVLGRADLVLTPEQTYVAAALDMLVAQRAQVFIGNGVSGLYFTLSVCHS